MTDVLERGGRGDRKLFLYPITAELSEYVLDQ